MPTPPWQDLPFLSAASRESDEVCALRAVRWLLGCGVGIRREGAGYKAFDLDTGFGLYHAEFDWCVFDACLAIIAAREARTKAAGGRG